MKTIEVIGLSKKYKLYNRPIDRIKESLNPLKKMYHKDFYALKSVSFSVDKGETLGIIGKNGSGKSTLLKILTGVLSSNIGTLNINGKISALLELGAGFNPELTGLQNIYLNGTLMGYSKKEIEKKLPQIIEFADIGDFINQPVKMYSSGMFVRLAFSVAINVDPDILIIDEALSVGDIRFQQKCYRKIREFKNNKTVIFVSHDLGAISTFCDRVIWLDQGEVRGIGLPDDVLENYHSYMNYNEEIRLTSEVSQESITIDTDVSIDKIAQDTSSFGRLGAEIVGASLLKNDQKGQNICGGDIVKLVFRIKANENITLPIVGFIIKDRLGNNIAIINTEFSNHKIDYLAAQYSYNFMWEFEFPKIRDGFYTLDLAIGEGTYENHIQHHWVNDAILVEVKNKKRYANAQGVCFIDKIHFNQL